MIGSKLLPKCEFLGFSVHDSICFCPELKYESISILISSRLPEFYASAVVPRVPQWKTRNILKDLHHEHIVRYIDRHVDRDAGILYILMEYCGGGDLSSIINQAAKHNRPIPEDTIWNYFMQILLALHHCHHPHTNARSNSGSGDGGTPEGSSGGGRDRRVQILHRDLKPDNGGFRHIC